MTGSLPLSSMPLDNCAMQQFCKVKLIPTFEPYVLTL
jgi:hypothetical protein